jgi:hypothetical protein
MCWDDGEVIARTTRVYERMMSSSAAALEAKPETWCWAVLVSRPRRRTGMTRVGMGKPIEVATREIVMSEFNVTGGRIRGAWQQNSPAGTSRRLVLQCYSTGMLACLLKPGRCQARRARTRMPVRTLRVQSRESQSNRAQPGVACCEGPPLSWEGAKSMLDLEMEIKEVSK